MTEALKSPLCVFAMYMVLHAQAQPTFERIYASTSSYKTNLIEQASGNLIFSSAWYPGISLLDPQGNVISSKCFYGDSVLTMGALRKFDENEFYFVASYRRDSCTASGSSTVQYTLPALGMMDSLGNILEFRHYTLGAGCSNSPGDLMVAGDKSVIVWGRDTRFFALKVDAEGDPVWGRRFSANGGFQFIKELPGGDLLAGINLDTAGAVVARMDANGNFIWCNSYIRPRGVVHDALIESDGSFIITGYTDSTTQSMLTPLANSFQPKLFMMKLDGEGDVQWCRGYDSSPNHWHTPRYSRITRTLDGNYALLATLGVPGYNFFHRPFLMKTDVNGDSLWTRSVGRPGYSYYTKDLLPTADGGFAFSGGIWGDLPNNQSGLPYIFKADSLGHFSCWEQSRSVVISDLFPTDSAVTLVSIDGAEVFSAFVNDTTFSPLTVYSGCTLSTGMPHSIAEKPRLYPNPTPGRFNVEFADPLLADSYYSLFDTMGKLLLQRPLPTGATLEEVDLTRFGAGSYVIKFTSPDGVCYERVVVD